MFTLQMKDDIWSAGSRKSSIFSGATTTKIEVNQKKIGTHQNTPNSIYKSLECEGECEAEIFKCKGEIFLVRGEFKAEINH
jgi:hypothetical protein